MAEKKIQHVQHVRGSQTAIDNYEGFDGEITINKTTDTLRVHDGKTKGGVGQAFSRHYSDEDFPETPPQDLHIGARVTKGEGHILGLGLTLVYNVKEVLTASGEYVAKATGWHKITCIGGGGAGGKGGDGVSPFNGGVGGKQGGTTTFKGISARGGSGGGGGAGHGGGGGGEAGAVVTDYVFLEKGMSVAVIIGAGGARSTADVKGTGGFGTPGEGPCGGVSGATPYTASRNVQHAHHGGGGAPGACGGSSYIPTIGSANDCAGFGGNGGVNGTGYGSGGGGGGGGNSGGEHGLGGAAAPDAEYGTNGANNTAAAGYGGRGGDGAVIVEYFDASK